MSEAVDAGSILSVITNSLGFRPEQAIVLVGLTTVAEQVETQTEQGVTLSGRVVRKLGEMRLVAIGATTAAGVGASVKGIKDSGAQSLVMVSYERHADSAGARPEANLIATAATKVGLPVLAEVRTLTQAQAVVSPQGGSAVATTVTLPYHWDRRHGAVGGQATFRLRVNVADPTQPLRGLAGRGAIAKRRAIPSGRMTSSGERSPRSMGSLARAPIVIAAR